MGSLGVHFAITEDQANALIAATGDEAVMGIIEDIEETYWDEWEPAGLVAETDKAWDAIHRALSDGSLNTEAGEEPLKWAVLGGRNLMKADDYIVTLTDPAQVEAVAKALKDIEKPAFRKRYDELVPEDFWLGKSDETFEYTWDWFQNLKEFYQKAAQAHRHVIFTADQ